MLQYIVGGSNAHEMIETAQQALENGCRWLRLDFSLLPQSEIEPVVKDLQERCNSLEAFLSLEDDVDNAAATKVSGVHLNVGSPADVIDARKRLGEEPFLGITVSSAADVPFIPRTAIDYIAVASDNLDDCLEMVKQMHATGLEEPVIAPYSHATALSRLMSTGINGIAVHHSTTPPASLKELLKELNTLVGQRLEEL